jgi:hypothetical protein
MADARPEPELDDPFEEWERYPVDEAEENIGYQKLAWYAAPFGSAGVGLLLLAAITNGLRRLGRAAIRLLIR